MGTWEYLVLLGCCLLVTAPLEMAGARVYRSPRRVCSALAPVVVVFGLWDWLAALDRWWAYSPDHVTGLHLGPLPIEEVAFFVVVPICALLTFEAVGVLWHRFAPARLRRGRV